MLTDSAPTAFDLRFRMLGTDVRIHPMFWVCSAFLGWSYVRAPLLPGNGMTDLALWIGCCFASILLHEFGHVFAIKAFGHDAHIVLHSFGGYAMPTGEARWRWQRIAVSAAGPAIQFALWGALVAAVWAGALPRPFAFSTAGWLPPVTPEFREEGPTPGRALMAMLLSVNLYWPLFNLLPIWPLDGGQIAREVFLAFSRRSGVIASLWLSLVLAAGIAVNAFVDVKGVPYPLTYLPRGTFVAVFFALFAFENFQAIQVENSMRREPWREDWP